MRKKQHIPNQTISSAAYEFIKETVVEAENYSARDALHHLQTRFTMDYSDPGGIGSRPASVDDEITLSFYLDMISIIGVPLKPILIGGAIFDNIEFSFQNWSAPYSSKHALGKIHFDLRHRTFRLGKASSRETWYVVMHPRDLEMDDLERSATERSHRRAQSAKHSAMLNHHAKIMAAFIKSVFSSEGLCQCSGVDASWGLNKSNKRQINHTDWTIFQEKFMEKWPEFIQDYTHDSFWTENSPAFHVYDHGSNTQINAPNNNGSNTQIEPPNDDGGGIEITAPTSLHYLDIESGLQHRPPPSSRQASQRQSSRRVTPNNARRSTSSRSSREGSRRSSSRSSRSEPYNTRQRHRSQQSRTTNNPQDGDPFETPSGEARDTDQVRGWFNGGLEQLRHTLHQKYAVNNISYISYAIAVEIQMVEEESGGDGFANRTYLANHAQVRGQYNSPRDFTFFPMAFHPNFGNFSSPMPPKFLEPICNLAGAKIGQDSNQREVLSAGFFQGYSNIKRVIRHTPDDLLASRGVATGALTLPPSAVNGNASARKQQRRLLNLLRGGVEPDSDPDLQRPFAREGALIENLCGIDLAAFRLEQVFHINTQNLITSKRNFYTVLEPIFYLTAWFRQRKQVYLGILHNFHANLFPRVLAAFSTVFDRAICSLRERIIDRGDKGPSVALAEAVAAIDRLGHYCYTGDPRVLPRKVLGFLGTTESLSTCAWPYISPEMLDFRELNGWLNRYTWPREPQGSPILLHIAAIHYHYGPTIASARLSQLRFSELRHTNFQDLASIQKYISYIFCDLWVPQMRAFVLFQLRRRIASGLSSTSTTQAHKEEMKVVSANLDIWEQVEHPFSQE